MPDDRTPPVILFGAERSGTTLLRLMLAAHPRVAVAPEFEFAFEPLAHQPGPPPPAEALRAHAASTFVWRDHGFEADWSRSYAEVVRGFLGQVLARKPGADRLVAGVHRHGDEVPRILPDARFVHVVRDPRDVARSNLGMGWAGNVYYGVDRWLAVERQWDRLKPTLGEDSQLELRQEDLIHDVRSTLGRLCDFLGVGYDEAMMTYADASTYESPDPTLTYQWKRKLTPRQIGLVEAKVGRLLTSRGYEPSGHAAVAVGPARRLALRLGDKAGTLRYRLGVNGLPLTLADYTSRLLRIGPWQRSVRARIRARRDARLR